MSPRLHLRFADLVTFCTCITSHSRTRLLTLTGLRHRTSVARIVCSLSRVMSAGESKVFLPSGAARGALCFQRQGVFGLMPSNIPGHCRWDLAQAALHAPSTFCPPLVQHIEEPVAHDGVDVDFAALRIAAVGLVFNECSGWGGWSGTGGADVGDLTVCERSGDGLSWSPPA